MGLGLNCSGSARNSLGLVGAMCILFILYTLPPSSFGFSVVFIYKAISCHLSSIVFPYVFLPYFVLRVKSQHPFPLLPCVFPLHHVTYCTCTLWPFGKSPDRNRVCFLLRSMLGYIVC